MTAGTHDGGSLAAGGDPRLAPSSQLADVVALLDASAALDADPGQARLRAEMLAFAATHPDALHRSCALGHFTGSALVLDDDGARTLVLHHRKLQRWLQPGGHADGDGNLAGVAWREATEETGIDGLRLDPVPIDVDIHEVHPPHEPAHLHLDVRFLVVAPPGAVAEGNHESEALRWVTSDELADLGTDEGTVRLARAGWARAAARSGRSVHDQPPS
jgi:8-oxo-dGTP pyrophosphatase MutT (NUDIX family)